jgi:RHS repeat-associated protein
MSIDRSHLMSSVGVKQLRIVGLAACVAFWCCILGYAQDFVPGTGTPTFGQPEPVEMGTVDAASGNLHLEIPLGSFPQRAGKVLDLKIAYDSSVWSIFSDGVSARWVNNQTDLGDRAAGGWRVVDSGSASLLELGTGCIFNLLAQEPNGTTHLFHVNLGTGTPSGSGGCTLSTQTTYATDASGFFLTEQCCSNGAILFPALYGPDGTCFWTSAGSANPCVQSADANGNFVTIGGIDTDTIGRQFLTFGSGAACTFNSANGVSYPKCYSVSNSQGTAPSLYTLTYADITLKTHFQQSGVSECTTNCIIPVIKSIALPDGSSYQFQYDCDSTTNTACSSPTNQTAYYGTVTRMILPTGSTIVYNYTNFVDSTGFVSHRIGSKQAPGGSWSYSPSVLNSSPTNTGACASGVSPSGSFVAGCQQVAITRPDNSKQVVIFGVNNGLWPFTTTNYDTDQATVLSTVHNIWDFSHPCTFNPSACNSIIDNGTTSWTNSDYIRKIQTRTTLSIPGGSITNQIAYSYGGPITNGNPTAIKEWKFQSGTSPAFSSVPDKATYLSYLTAAHNNVSHPTSIRVCNNSGSDPSCAAGGSTVALTSVTYDGYGMNGSLVLMDVPFADNHDDSTFGPSFTSRGNPTQVSRLVAGSTSLTIALSYDTTGQVIKAVDTNNNATTFSYADKFFNDNGANPPAPFTPSFTGNAYITSETDSAGTSSFGYYYGSGNIAVTTDYNGVSTYSHYLDVFDRPTATILPSGWSLNAYTSPTQVDSYGAVADTTPSTSCTSCFHSQAVLDQLGRVVQEHLVNSPGGDSLIGNTYDALSRIISTSHPHIGTSDPNNVNESASYDGLGRRLTATHPDGQSSKSAYGAKVTTLGGVTTQQSSTTTYGVGYPVISIDEAGKQRQEWIDGFGHVIEVDEPSATTATAGSASVTVSGSEQFASTCPPSGGCQTIPNSGTVSVTVNGFSASGNYGPTVTTSMIASSIASGFNSSSSPVSASVSGSTVMMTLKLPGANFSFSTSATYSSTMCASGTTSAPCFSGPSFSASPASGSSTNASGGVSTSPFVTTYTYDVLGKLTSVLQGAQTRSYSYDGLSRLTQESTPEAGSVTISYQTSAGSLCSGDPSNPCLRTDARGITTTYLYDSANRLVSKSYNPSTTGNVTYTYGTSSSAHNIGRLVKMTDASGSESYSYDASGRTTSVAKVVGAKTYNIGYQYNAGGELTQLTYPSGRIVQYSYDAVGNPCVVAATTSGCSNSTSPYLTITPSNYDAAGRPLSGTYGNGVVATATYSPQRSQLATLSYTKGATNLFGINYFYQQNSSNCPTGAMGNNGQVQCIVDLVQPGRGLQYTYDTIGRLITASTAGSTAFPAWGLSETFDRYGNRTAQTVTAGSGFNSSLVVNAANNQIAGFTYDASGNVIAEPSPLSTTYSYDGEDCQTGYTGNGSSATYTCDGNGLRVKKVVTGTGAVTTVFIYADGSLIDEYDNGAAQASPSREYVYGGSNDSFLAAVTGSTGGAGGTISYRHRDLVSQRLFTDANGTVVHEHGSYPFGELWYQSGTSTSFVFASYERDKESGNDYALAREYENSSGRFLSPDPEEGEVDDPQLWNRYAYARNDPINITDPSGRGFWEALGFAIADIFVAFAEPGALPWVLQLESEGATAQAVSNIILPCTFPCLSISVGRHSTSTVKAAPCPPGMCGEGNPGEGDSNSSTDEQGSDDSNGGLGGQGSGGGSRGGSGTGSGGGVGSGDVAVGYDIWHCAGCGQIWTEANSSVYEFMESEVMSAAMGGALAKLGGAAGAYLSRLPRMQVAIGKGGLWSSPIHVAYKVGGTLIDSDGPLLRQEVYFGRKEARATFMRAYTTFRIPIRNEAAILATKGRPAWSCVTSAIHAAWNGWVP